MDTYLTIAEKVLRRQRSPLSASQILRIAYTEDLAPAHLRGRTQHKTLQARLSENILHLRENSRFYRTAPGRFFLREFLYDPSIPENDRKPIAARRRTRDLARAKALAVKRSSVEEAVQCSRVSNVQVLLNIIEGGDYHYLKNSRSKQENDVLVWSFALVVRSGKVLSYRAGSYREQRDGFFHKRSVGFYAPVAEDDLSLFDRYDHGILSCGLKTLATDLDMSGDEAWHTLSENSKLETVIYPCSDQAWATDLLAVIRFSCPKWMEPTSNRLAVNDLQWLDLTSPPNHWEDFDPWSQAVLAEARRIALEDGPVNGEEKTRPKSRANCAL